MTFLLDTCVLSALARPHQNPRVLEFVSRNDPADLFVSMITMGELAKGWHLLPEGRRKQELGRWIAVTERQYATRLLSVDPDVARLWGELTALAQQQGVVVPAADGPIAATALHHGLHVATRNTRNFTATGALVHDPWEAS